MAPEWYFTSTELENYMPIATRKKWDTGEVGMKLEVFAIAGCDPVNLLRTSKQKADWMKVEIRGGVGKKRASGEFMREFMREFNCFGWLKLVHQPTWAARLPICVRNTNEGRKTAARALRLKSVNASSSRPLVTRVYIGPR
ncbi:hypothetical protein B0H17DRAFT_1147622 [Mycena rosella]|uniref:Uncharacterized protein n=1 Tax=Mycena rosella TaxID=1033263 RepID=A0AAD7CL84_MYCRO|nr:hypothetical protein B0H17DRAFT_1147622 [Mycena rosella]